MRKHFILPISLFVLLALVAGIVGTNMLFAKASGVSSSANQGIAGGTAVTIRMSSMQTSDMHTVHALGIGTSTKSPLELKELGENQAVADQLQKSLQHNSSIPRPGTAQKSLPTTLHPNASTPGTTHSFQAMADSTTICPPSGCQPPDMAIASSPSWVFQGVNTSFAVYSPSGTLQAGWPIAARDFFNIPNPGSCAPNGAFTSDPRAFYDPTAKHFWVAILEAEGAFANNTCPAKTVYHIGVSQTADPRGAWNLYAFDMSLGTANVADYTQFGFDQHAFYVSANMFSGTGGSYQYAEILGGLKSSMQQGQATTLYGFSNLYAQANRKVLVDTVQPVETESGNPTGGLFINTFNGGEFGQFNGDPYNDDCTTTTCHGLVVWTLTHPGTSSTGLSAFVLSNTSSYILPPEADQPGCSACIRTGDTRISGTPVYRNGYITFSQNTSINNGTQNVSGILWGQVKPTLNSSGAVTKVTRYQQGYYYYTGSSSDYYGTLMADKNGNLLMVFEFSSGSSNPGVAYVSRHTTTPLGSLDDAGVFLRQGDAATFDSRWGDFEATSFNNNTLNQIWFAGQYSATNQDWSTYIGAVKLS